MKSGDLINQEAPTLYRHIAKKMMQKSRLRKISRKDAKRILGLCFKVGKDKNKIFKELEDYGLLIFVNRHEYYIHYEEVEDEGMQT